MVRAFLAIISGRVQGVLFRDYAKDRAGNLHIVGEVQNLPDGTVRVYAEGFEEKLIQFLNYLEQGSLLSNVEQVSCEWIKPQGGFETFLIRES